MNKTIKPVSILFTIWVNKWEFRWFLFSTSATCMWYILIKIHTSANFRPLWLRIWIFFLKMLPRNFYGKLLQLYYNLKKLFYIWTKTRIGTSPIFRVFSQIYRTIVHGKLIHEMCPIIKFTWIYFFTTRFFYVDYNIHSFIWHHFKTDSIQFNFTLQ